MAINLDLSYIGPYLQDWLAYIRESSDAEQLVILEGKEFYIPYSGVQAEMISAIFAISDRFKIDPHAKYLGVHLLDRYMARFFWELISSTKLNENVIRQVRETMSGQMKLVLASCLQIASKMDLWRTGLGISQIQDLLQSIDPDSEYTKSDISSCELRILKSLDFRLPLSLPVHVVEIFLAYSGLTSTPQIRDTCFHLLDVVYLRHDAIFQQLHLMARGRSYQKNETVCRDFMSLEANSAFVGAAVVVCSNFFYNLKRRVVDTLAAKLASLIDMSAIDVNIMANILFTQAIDEEDFKELHQRLAKSEDKED